MPPSNVCRRPVVAAFAAVGALMAVGIPATAQASTVSLENGALVVRAAPGETNWFGVRHGWDRSRLRISDSSRPTAYPSSCFADDDEGLNALNCETPPNGVRVEAGDRNDIVDVGDDDAAVAVTADAGDGNDVMRAHTWGVRMLGNAGNDTITGSTGDDVADGGAGDDDLQGLAGNDGVFGGDGNDKLSGDGYDVVGNDVIDGGPGYDQIDTDWTSGYPNYQPPISVSLDGTGGDGRPGESDNVTGIEKIYMNAPVTLIGGDAAEDFSMFNADGGGRLVGNGGDDKLTGFDLADTIEGGTGNDTIAGGYGDDTISGGPGRDTISADVNGTTCSWIQCRMPYGNDTVDAHDGEADSVDCGIGDDVAYVDPIDRVSGCESVRNGAAPGTGGGGPQGGAGGTPQAGGGVAAKLAVTKVRASLRRGMALTVRAPGAGRLTARATRGRRVVGRRTAKVARARTITLRIRLARRARVGQTLKVNVVHVAAGGAATSATVRVRVNH